MQRLMSFRPLLAVAVTLGALAGASAAHARGDVTFSIGIHAPYGYARPAPVYVQPAPVYVQPAPVYVQPRPVYVERPGYRGHPGYHGHRPHHRGPWGDRDRDGVPNAYDRDGRHPYGYHGGHGRGWRDADRDGVPNRYDHAPRNPYRY